MYLGLLHLTQQFLHTPFTRTTSRVTQEPGTLLPPCVAAARVAAVRVAAARVVGGGGGRGRAAVAVP